MRSLFLRSSVPSSGTRQRCVISFLHGEQVVNKDYKRTRISIAFHPDEERFEVANAAICRDKGWIADISTVFAPDVRIRQLVDCYCEANHIADKYEIDDRMERLRGIRNNPLGVIELNSDLEVETVAEIFVRINSQGITLNTADFAMSKMAASEQYDGHRLRKCIDYFCHLAVAPEAYNDLGKDAEFASIDYFRAMEWLKNKKDDLYDPSYTDMLRVMFTSQFKRGRLEDLVALLSGRNFETRYVRGGHRRRGLSYTHTFRGIGSGVFEIRADHRTDTYRAVYAVKIGERVYVLHCFQKKSRRRVKTPKKEISLIKRRLRMARELEASKL